MRNYILACMSIFILQACNQKKNTLKQKPEGLDVKIAIDTLIGSRAALMTDSLRNKLIDSAILYGNKEAYLKVANSQPFLGPDLLFPALIMANKYNDSKASFDVYYMLCEEGYDSLSLDFGTLDKRTESIGLYYLLKSYELGFDDAKETVEDLYIQKHLKVPKSNDIVIFK